MDGIFGFIVIAVVAVVVRSLLASRVQQQKKTQPPPGMPPQNWSQSNDFPFFGTRVPPQTLDSSTVPGSTRPVVRAVSATPAVRDAASRPMAQAVSTPPVNPPMRGYVPPILDVSLGTSTAPSGSLPPPPPLAPERLVPVSMNPTAQQGDLSTVMEGVECEDQEVHAPDVETIKRPALHVPAFTRDTVLNGIIFSQVLSRPKVLERRFR